jgi:hypothetical protein
MPNMDVWSWTLLSGGAFIAVSVLVGLMRRRRDALLADLTSQAEEEKQRKKLADQLEKRKQRKKPKAA